MALSIWIILCIFMLNLTASLAEDQQPVGSLNLGESPACKSQSLPKGIREWSFTGPRPISVKWTYVAAVSFFSKCKHQLKL